VSLEELKDFSYCFYIVTVILAQKLYILTVLMHLLFKTHFQYRLSSVF